MSKLKVTTGFALFGYISGLVLDSVLDLSFVSLAAPALSVFLASGTVYYMTNSKLKAAAKQEAARSEVRLDGSTAAQSTIAAPSGRANTLSAVPTNATVQSSNSVQQQEPHHALGEEWSQLLEYIGAIEDMVILEGQKNQLDDEIVEKTLSLLARLDRIIPQLVEFSNSEMNHNIKRLVLRDLNGVITPFLNLSGEAKRQNRRILLNGLKDINSKITFYTETIEHKDLIELRSKAELIHQRYNSNVL
ncbi:hypothetical protein [Paenibacillus sp. 481]|uniref:hypothetical protein n=1 Tax=Paenibacillus sp. 481 TaxID=2835869 RepID=UPI001E45D259|nr:hypothetical protein [Paenibacillus sp. 481]UHA74796.1 hypothetical protein KIK04_06975 [Paenibacillus sp. 481]